MVDHEQIDDLRDKRDRLTALVTNLLHGAPPEVDRQFVLDALIPVIDAMLGLHPAPWSIRYHGPLLRGTTIWIAFESPVLQRKVAVPVQGDVYLFDTASPGDRVAMGLHRMIMADGSVGTSWTATEIFSGGAMTNGGIGGKGWTDLETMLGDLRARFSGVNAKALKTINDKHSKPVSSLMTADTAEKVLKVPFSAPREQAAEKVGVIADGDRALAEAFGDGLLSKSVAHLREAVCRDRRDIAEFVWHCCGKTPRAPRAQRELNAAYRAFDEAKAKRRGADNREARK